MPVFSVNDARASLIVAAVRDGSPPPVRSTSFDSEGEAGFVSYLKDESSDKIPIALSISFTTAARFESSEYA